MQTIIETKRLLLRPFQLEDAEDVFALNSNEKVNEYTGQASMKSIDEALDVIQNTNIKDFEKYGYGRFAVIHKEDQKLIGFSGLKYLPDLAETDLGYRFLPEYWGKGLATESALASVQFGFVNLNLQRIIGIAMKDNLASIKVLEKCGLNYYKTAEYDGDGLENKWYKLEKKDYQRH